MGRVSNTRDKQSLRPELTSGARHHSTKSTLGGFQHGDHARTGTLTLLLEEITDRPLEPDLFFQTELARVRPDTPPFSPATTFRDADTKILHNDLFVFDREVKSLLEILIGQSVEQVNMARNPFFRTSKIQKKIQKFFQKKISKIFSKTIQKKISNFFSKFSKITSTGDFQSVRVVSA